MNAQRPSILQLVELLVHTVPVNGAVGGKGGLGAGGDGVAAAAQMVKPAACSKLCVSHDNVWLPASCTLFGPVVPLYVTSPMLMRSQQLAVLNSRTVRLIGTLARTVQN